jgi:hypothetical protein
MVQASPKGKARCPVSFRKIIRLVDAILGAQFFIKSRLLRVTGRFFFGQPRPQFRRAEAVGLDRRASVGERNATRAKSSLVDSFRRDLGLGPKMTKQGEPEAQAQIRNEPPAGSRRRFFLLPLPSVAIGSPCFSGQSFADITEDDSVGTNFAAHRCSNLLWR